MTQPELSRAQLLLDAPIGAMLLKLAAPNIAATLMMTVVTFADAWFVGQLGTVALASQALVFPFQILMILTAVGAIGGGVTSSVSRALGRGNNAMAQDNAWHGLVIACVLALLYTIVLGFFARPVFSLLGGTGEVLNGAIRYAHIAFGGALAVILLWVLSAIVRGTGDTVTPARAVLLSGVAQIALSGALTLGWGPFPDWGIAGPAAAMVICQGFAAVYLAAHLISDHRVVRLQAYTIRWQPIQDIMQVGGLGLINSVTIAFTVVLVTGFIGQYGTAALAGYGVGSRLELMLVPIAFGIGGALTVAVGTNVGAGQFARARRIAWLGGGVGFLITGLIGAIVAVVPGLWLDLFTTDPKAYEFGASYLAIVAPFYGFFGAGQALYFASQGTGRMLLPVSVGVARLLIVTAIGFLAIAMAWPVTAVFVAVAAGLTTIGIGLSLCMLTAAWKAEVKN